MRSLVLIVLFATVGCATTHNDDHRHPGQAIGYDLVTGDRASASVEQVGHKHDNDTEPEEAHEHESASLEELPDDPAFCDLNGDGSIEDEIKDGKLCQIEGVRNDAFSAKPILALGLQKGELILTIDDGPTSGVTDDILDTLKSYGIKATFFLTGNRISSHASIVRRMYREGHTIGNHTYSHNVRNITSSTIAGEILRAHQEVVNVLGEEPEGRLLFRAPGLAWNTLKARNLNAGSKTRTFIGPIHANLGTDAPVADWHCWSKSGGRKSAQRCADMYFDLIMRKGRGIVLAHDLNAKTADMIRILLDRLQRNGGIKNASSGGVWNFKTLQDNTALNKFDSGEGPVVSVSEPAPSASIFSKPSVTVRDASLEDKSESAKLDNSTRIYISGDRYLQARDILEFRHLNESIRRGGYTLRQVQITRMRDGLERYNERKVYIWEAAF